MPRTAILTFVLLAAFAAAAPTSASAAPARISITGGHAPTRPYPYMAYVVTEKQAGPYACGGTLIASRWVLTAGHCVADPETSRTKAGPAQVRLVLGKTDLQTIQASDVLAVSRVELHPAYKPMPGHAHNDIALLELAVEPAVAPARLPRPRERARWAPRKVRTAIGYGKTSAAGTQGSALLLETELAIRRKRDCRQRGVRIRHAVTMCAGSRDGRGVCYGDSGSPLLSGNTVGGVVSVASQTCNGRFQAFARIGDRRVNRWIRSIVA